MYHYVSGNKKRQYTSTYFKIKRRQTEPESVQSFIFEYQT